MDTRKGVASTIGERLQERMDLRDENAHEAAKRLDVGYATIYGLLNGKRTNPSLDVLEKLARGYNVSVGWLVEGSGAEASPFLPITAEDARELKQKLTEALDAIERMERKGKRPTRRTEPPLADRDAADAELRAIEEGEGRAGKGKGKRARG